MIDKKRFLSEKLIGIFITPVGQSSDVRPISSYPVVRGFISLNECTDGHTRALHNEARGFVTILMLHGFNVLYN